jgi:hypothetical protein
MVLRGSAWQSSLLTEAITRRHSVALRSGVGGGAAAEAAGVEVMATAAAAAAEAAAAEAWRPSRRHSEAPHSNDPRGNHH